MAIDERYLPVQPEIRQMPERRILYVVGRSVDHDSFSDAFRHAVGTLFGHIAAHDIPYEAGTFTGLTPFWGGNAESPAWGQASVNLVAGANPPTTDEVKIGVLESGRELVGIHVGPYGTLMESWGLLDGYRRELGEEVRGGFVYDVYVDDPSVGEERMRTEMHFPLV